jgi:pyruvate, orthophosphate dikinase
LEKIVEDFLALVRREWGKDFPEDPRQQLFLAVEAVFKSWNTNRAIVYRKANRIPETLGTAVNIQTMVFGNLGNDSGTGVAFTRNPSTGEAKLYGEYLLNAQGEDVVAGIRTPFPLTELKEVMPAVYEQFIHICNKLEMHYGYAGYRIYDRKGYLYMLQTRTGKRTAPAAVKIAVDMVREGLITRKEALQRVEPEQIEQLLHRRINPEAKLTVYCERVAGFARGGIR